MKLYYSSEYDIILLADGTSALLANPLQQFASLAVWVLRIPDKVQFHLVFMADLLCK